MRDKWGRVRKGGLKYKVHPPSSSSDEEDEEKMERKRMKFTRMELPASTTSSRRNVPTSHKISGMSSTMTVEDLEADESSSREGKGLEKEPETEDVEMMDTGEGHVVEDIETNLEDTMETGQTGEQMEVGKVEVESLEKEDFPVMNSVGETVPRSADEEAGTSSPTVIMSEETPEIICVYDSKTCVINDDVCNSIRHHGKKHTSVEADSPCSMEGWNETCADVQRRAIREESSQFEKIPVPLTNEQMLKLMHDRTRPAYPREQSLVNFFSIRDRRAQVMEFLEQKIDTIPCDEVIGNLFVHLMSGLFKTGIPLLPRDPKASSKFFSDSKGFLFRTVDDYKLMLKFTDKKGVIQGKPSKPLVLPKNSRYTCPYCHELLGESLPEENLKSKPIASFTANKFSHHYKTYHSPKREDTFCCSACANTFDNDDERDEHATVHVDDPKLLEPTDDPSPHGGKSLFLVNLFEPYAVAVKRYNESLRRKGRRFSGEERMLSLCWLERATDNVLRVMDPTNGKLEATVSSMLFWMQFMALLQINMRVNPLPILPAPGNWKSIFTANPAPGVDGFLFNRGEDVKNPYDYGRKFLSIIVEEECGQLRVVLNEWESRQKGEKSCLDGHGKTKYPCYLCDGTNRMTETQLRDHFKKHHFASASERCFVCGSILTTHQEIQRHEKKKTFLPDWLRNGFEDHVAYSDGTLKTNKMTF